MSKIFFFPLKCVPTEWVEKKEIWVNSSETQLIYFIITKASAVPNPEPIVPVKIILNSFFKLLPKNHVVERDTYMPGGDSLARGAEDSDTDKRKSGKTQDDRFSRPKPLTQWQKPSRTFLDTMPEKKLYPRQFDREDSLTSEFLGKRLQNHHLFEPSKMENENLESLHPLAAETYSSLKLLKETTRTSYDKIMSDMALQTSRRTNQDLGAWPFRSEEEKQSKNANLLNFLSKSKTGQLLDKVESTEHSMLKDAFLKSKAAEVKPFGSLESLLSKDKRMFSSGTEFYPGGEYREQRESTLKKAISAIRSSKFKTGVDYYGSPKLHEQPAGFPPGF